MFTFANHKNMFMSLRNLTLLFLLFFAISCSNEVEVEGPEVCFEQEVLPILVSNCTQSECHNPIDREKDLDLSSFSDIKSLVKTGDYNASKLFSVMVIPFGSARMPPSPYDALSEEQLRTVALWIEQGAKNNSCMPTVCDTTNVFYSGTIAPMLKFYCTGCHSGSNPQGNLDLTTYANVKEVVDDNSLLGTIEWMNGFNKMPKNGSKLTNCNILKIKKWIAVGAPNN